MRKDASPAVFWFVEYMRILCIDVPSHISWSIIHALIICYTASRSADIIRDVLQFPILRAFLIGQTT